MSQWKGRGGSGMKIGVIADTHVGDKYPALHRRVKEQLQGVDLILHCGDVITMDVLDELREVAPVEAIAGNHDVEVNLDLPRKKVLEVGGYRIGMIHGDELHGVHVTKRQLKEWLRQVVVEPFIDENGLDIIVFGHYHQPVIDAVRVEFVPEHLPTSVVKRDVLLFNPGAALRNRHLSSVGLIELYEGRYDVSVKVFLPERKIKK
jgi:putative phosphoesterase